MKTVFLLLLILDVFKFSTTEFRHFQRDRRHSRGNVTAQPWSSKEKEIGKIKPILSVGKEKNLVKSKNVEAFRSGQPNNYRNLSEFFIRDDENNETKKRENKTNVNFLERKKRIKVNKVTKKSIFSDETEADGRYKNPRLEIDNSTAVFNSTEEINFQNYTLKLPKKNNILNEKTNYENEDYAYGESSYDDGENSRNLNFLRGISNHFAEPLSALNDGDETENCGENIVKDFVVTDDLVTLNVLTDRNEAEKLTTVLGGASVELDEMTDLMESTMGKRSRIISISISVENKAEKTKIFQTVYRKGNDLFTDISSRGHLNFATQTNRNSWTSLFENCLTKTWIFGYHNFFENENVRIDAIVYFSSDEIKGTVDQCNPSYHQILNGGPKCDGATTKCMGMPNSGFKIGGYKCMCEEGFHLPENYSYGEDYFSGFDVEKAYSDGKISHLKCLPCLKRCKGSCDSFGFCLYQRNNLLRNSILSIQIFCILTTTVLTILVFKHRKCKTVSTGMWTIMEMILVGSIILYNTIIIRAFNPSTNLCLIEPWCREMGFVLVYGAIILKLYRILIEFRTRKAHRWVIRDKDLLKYLLGMVIIVFGYMSAWTATNLDLIQKQNYSMLTAGVTSEGFHFKACKVVWWNYVTETSEILILMFGIHISYASRNATTQFRERCFLCISISVEALISGIFYILRHFYWEVTLHPDISFVANFTRCQLTTTVVLLLLFTPKWWYQKIQISKGRVSRNYLMQESGKEPLEAFKSQTGIVATNSDAECEISLADMNPDDIRAELKRLYTQLQVLKNKTIRLDNPHISKRRGGRKIAHRRFSLQKKGSREKALRHQTQRLSLKYHADIEITEAEVSRTPEDSVCSNEGPSVVLNDGPSDIISTTPRKNQK